ncbi:OmpH family outer membrane protein [Panacagrimonas sp.]|uniref:OmpH family outer membrane protein n=1 Tax=Panacagrimonas sp. TaxID=2480088 RepID=UPI003B51D870
MPAHAELKILSIRAAEIVAASPQFAASQNQMKTEFEKRKADLEAEARKFAEDTQKFRREADVMSSDARAKAEKDLQTRRIDIDYKQRQFGEDFQKRDRELSESLMNSIKQVVVEIATEQGADMVVQDPVFAAPGVDVTDLVIKRLQGGK